jgi:hypothetical protein
VPEPEDNTLPGDRYRRFAMLVEEHSFGIVLLLFMFVVLSLMVWQDLHPSTKHYAVHLMTNGVDTAVLHGATDVHETSQVLTFTYQSHHYAIHGDWSYQEEP